jgi:hypothetical protein
MTFKLVSISPLRTVTQTGLTNKKNNTGHFDPDFFIRLSVLLVCRSASDRATFYRTCSMPIHELQYVFHVKLKELVANTVYKFPFVYNSLQSMYDRVVLIT